MEINKETGYILVPYDIKTNIIPLVNENIYVYGQYVRVIEIENYNNVNILLHLEESIVVPDSRYTTDIININEYIK